MVSAVFGYSRNTSAAHALSIVNLLRLFGCSLVKLTGHIGSSSTQYVQCKVSFFVNKVITFDVIDYFLISESTV